MGREPGEEVLTVRQQVIKVPAAWVESKWVKRCVATRWLTKWQPNWNGQQVAKLRAKVGMRAVIGAVSAAEGGIE